LPSCLRSSTKARRQACCNLAIHAPPPGVDRGHSPPTYTRVQLLGVVLATCWQKGPRPVASSSDHQPSTVESANVLWFLPPPGEGPAITDPQLDGAASCGTLAAVHGRTECRRTRTVKNVAIPAEAVEAVPSLSLMMPDPGATIRELIAATNGFRTRPAPLAGAFPAPTAVPAAPQVKAKKCRSPATSVLGRALGRHGGQLALHGEISGSADALAGGKGGTDRHRVRNHEIKIFMPIEMAARPRRKDWRSLRMRACVWTFAAY
jgi:hypothetical protein